MRIKSILMTGLLFSSLLMSCSDEFGEQNINNQAINPGSGLFIVNEGNWGAGNGSISFYSYEEGKVYNDLFMSANERPLGDLPAFMAISGDVAVITVNNSGKIEIINPLSLKAKHSLTGFPSPRQVLILDDQTAVISSLADPNLTFINPSNGSLIRRVNLNRSSEAMTLLGDALWVSNWSRFYVDSDNRFVMKVDLNSFEVTDSVEVGLEPQSMVTDKHGRLWVLCSGGWDNSEYPSLHCLDFGFQGKHSVFTFPDKNSSPTHLCINGTRDTLFYLNQGVYMMDIDEASLPQSALIPGGSSYYYALTVDPMGRGIFLSEPLDFQQNGIVRRFDHQGNEISNFRASVIPGSFCFN